MNGEDTQLFAISLQEFLRRILLSSQEDPNWTTPSRLVMAQVRILHAVGLAYSGDRLHSKFGLDMQQAIASCHADVVNERMPALASDSPQSTSVEDEWRSWIRLEGMARTAHCIWLVDCMWAYQFQRRPLLALGDTSVPLPCHKMFWIAVSAQDWKDLSPSQNAVPGLQEALQEIYIDKRLPKARGEFARMLMIHGLFHRTWEVERYLGNPMSQWEPTAKKQSSVQILASTPVWVPSIPIYTKWQNSVCDCLDILHWQANATIGQASGFEHPTVAQLHLARVVLLSPLNSIVDLAKAMTDVESTMAKDDATMHRRTIQRWAIQGQYKARLAAIHAGVVFWHIQRYSVDGFYEAPAVAVAALMLWAFGTFSPKQSSGQYATSSNQVQTAQVQRDINGSQDEESDDPACGIILLDRPTDDELVQQFVRRGHTMQAHITGVGDLYGARGPERVLVEGCKLLSVLKCWGVSTTWLNLLQKLIDVCKSGNGKS